MSCLPSLPILTHAHPYVLPFQDAVIAVFCDDAELNAASGVEPAEPASVPAPSPSKRSATRESVRRALSCALQCMQAVHGLSVIDHTMKLHIGIGAGKIAG